MRRYTFVIQVHPDGITTLENLATRQQIQVLNLATVGPQIGRWLEGVERLTALQTPPVTPSGKERA